MRCPASGRARALKFPAVHDSALYLGDLLLEVAEDLACLERWMKMLVSMTRSRFTIGVNQLSTRKRGYEIV